MKTTTLALIAATCFLISGISCFISVAVEGNWLSFFFGLANFVFYTMVMKAVIDDKD